MQNLIISKRVKVNFTAEQWELYTASDDLDCRPAAEALNKALEKAVNKGLPKGEVREAVNVVRDKYSRFGAADTEPRYILEDALTAIFGH